MADEEVLRNQIRGVDLRQLGHAALKWYVRRFPISKGKARLVTHLWEPLSSGRTQREVVLRQADIRLSCDLTMTIQRHLYFWGSYEERSCHHWINLSRGSKIIFDIGANVGLYSLLAASANPSSSVYAFEPTPEMATAFEENIRLNGMRNIFLERIAVGRLDHIGYLNVCVGSDGTNEGMNFVADTPSNDSSLPVKVVSLDQYCRRNGIERVDLVKMDIEGGEYDALLGARRLLRQGAIRCLFIEMIEWAANRSGHSLQEIESLLLDVGYRLYGLRGRELIPIAAGEAPDGENVVAFPREQDQVSGQQAP